MTNTTDTKETIVVIEDRPIVENDLCTSEETRVFEPPPTNESEDARSGSLQSLTTDGNSLVAIILSTVIGLIVPGE